MKNFLLIGGSYGIGSGIVSELLKDKDNFVHVVSKTEVENENKQNLKWHSYDAINDEFSLQDLGIDELSGFAYLPGSIVLKPFLQSKREDFENAFQVNFYGAIKNLKIAIPALKKSKNSSIVLFSTVATIRAMSFHTVVGSVKAALEGLSLSLSAELAPTVRVNVIAPSLTNTPLAKDLVTNSKILENAISKHALKRIGKVQDISKMARFLLTEESSWITGQVFSVDGGLSKI